MQIKQVIPLALALAAAPVAVHAQEARLGYALGTKRVDGSCKDTADYEADFDVLKPTSDLVRGYAAQDCDFALKALPAAKKKGFQITLGIWADTDEGFTLGKAAVEAAASQYADQIYAVTVGSESLYRGNFTGDELAELIQDVKRAVPDIKVGTADSWNKYADGTADPVIRVSDIVLINAFPYWQGQDINNATATLFYDFEQALGRVQDVRGSFNGIEVQVGETGWLTEGSNYDAAEPGLENAERFFKRGICAMRRWGVDVYVFEAFDEPWKPVSVGDNGEEKDERHWGVFEEDRRVKYDNTC